MRDGTTGKSSFIQGAAASRVQAQLKANGANKDAILAPLVEDDEDDLAEPSFMGEIKANNSGSYNFQWRIGDRHGLGTAEFHTTPKPSLTLVDVSDSDGNKIDVNPTLHRQLLQQARAFLGNE